jgi:predicted nucleic acid-binding protein
LAEIVVADAGPLIALGRLRKIELLTQIFAKVIVPRTVFEETQFRSDLPDAQTIFAAQQSGVFIVENSSVGSASLPPDGELGDGEAAAISLAAALGHGVLIDDKHGRAVAATLNLRVIGTVGVLLIARRRELIPALKPLLEELKVSGYYLSAELIQGALRRVGE